MSQGGTRCTVLALAYLFCAQQATAEKKKKQQDQAQATQWAQPRPIPDRFMDATGGQFVFSELYLVPDTLGAKLVGVVTNRTTKRWDGLLLEFAITSGTGERKTYLLILDHRGPLSPGMSTGFSAALWPLPATSASAEFVMSSGRYPAFYEFSLEKPVRSKVLNYSIPGVEIEIVPQRDGLGIKIHNTGEGAIKIDWNQVSFVDVDGRAGPVMHSGIKYSDTEAIKAPSIIPPTAVFEDVIIPTASVYFVKGEYGGWRTSEMFPDAPAADSLKGKTFGYVRPVLPDRDWGQDDRHIVLAAH